MVAPELEACVTGELSKETATMKEMRKAREEKVGTTPAPKPGPKGGGGGRLSSLALRRRGRGARLGAASARCPASVGGLASGSYVSAGFRGPSAAVALGPGDSDLLRASRELLPCPAPFPDRYIPDAFAIEGKCRTVRARIKHSASLGEWANEAVFTINELAAPPSAPTPVVSPSAG